MSEAISVTVVGEPVTEAITLDGIGRYLVANGWERREFGSPTVYAVFFTHPRRNEHWGHAERKDRWLLFTTPVCADNIGKMLGWLAHDEGRHVAVVLREIAECSMVARREAWRAQLIAEGRCMADNDVDCDWERCPQLRERKTTCPRWLATRARLDPDDDGR